MRPKNMEILQASVVVDLYFILIPVVYRFENLKVYWLSIEWKEVHLQKSMQAAANSSSCLQEKNSCACVYLRKPEQNLYQNEILDAECYKIKNVIYFSQWR